MSARDAESGSSTYKGGSGRAGGLGNGGVGGGMGGGGNYGGGMGGGAARNGGIGSRTGLTTGNRMYGVAGRNGVTFSGRPGGFAQQPGAFGVRPAPAITQGPLNRPAVPGLLSPTPAAMPGVAPVPEYVPQLPDMYYPPYTTPATVPGVPAPPAAPAVPEVYTPWNPFAQTTPGTTPNGIRPAGEYGARRTGPNSSEFNKNFNSSRGYGGGNTVRQNGY